MTDKKYTILKLESYELMIESKDNISKIVAIKNLEDIVGWNYSKVEIIHGYSKEKTNPLNILYYPQINHYPLVFRNNKLTALDLIEEIEDIH